MIQRNAALRREGQPRIQFLKRTRYETGGGFRAVSVFAHSYKNIKRHSYQLSRVACAIEDVIRQKLNNSHRFLYSFGVIGASPQWMSKLMSNISDTGNLLGQISRGTERGMSC